MAVTGVSLLQGANTVTASYTVAAPGGSWDAADNGTYTISTVANQVSDGTSLFAPAATLGSFDVSVPVPEDNGVPVGDFGLIGRKRQKLNYTDPDNTKVTFALSGAGTGHVLLVGGKLAIVLEGTGTSTSLSVTGKGGDNRVALGNVSAHGAVKSISAPTTDLSGTVVVAGVLRKATVGNLTGTLRVGGTLSSLEVRGGLTGTLKADGAISKLTVRGALMGNVVAGFAVSSLNVRGNLSGGVSAGGKLSKLSVAGNLTGVVAAGGGIGSVAVRGNVSGAKVLAGATLGADGQTGGTGFAADSFAAGAIASIKVSGAVSGGSLSGAGLDPVDGVFGNGDDRVVGGTASVIRSVSVKKGVDPLSRFVAGAFGKVRVPGGIDLATDARFKLL